VRTITLKDIYHRTFVARFSHRREGLIITSSFATVDQKKVKFFTVTHEKTRDKIGGGFTSLKCAKAWQKALLGFAKNLGFSWNWERDRLKNYLQEKKVSFVSSFSAYRQAKGGVA
jgi:hypothetical protein